MNNSKNKMSLATKETEVLLRILEERFEKNMKRHQGVEWSIIQKKLEANSKKLWSIYEMEKTGGEPDVVVLDKKSGELLFCDCSEESPSGRRSLCYDGEALRSRKENKPKNSALEMAEEMGIGILTETEYRDLQKLGEFDTRSQSWIQTPVEIRNLGGAIFVDRRYDHVFTYHNGAESYYAVRGFRGSLKV